MGLFEIKDRLVLKRFDINCCALFTILLKSWRPSSYGFLLTISLLIKPSVKVHAEVCNFTATSYHH